MKNYNLGLKQTKDEFKRKYPKAKLSMFEFDVSIPKSGDIGEISIFYNYDKQGDGYDITSDTFKSNKKWIMESLGLNLQQAAAFQYYGEENYNKSIEVLKREINTLKNGFSKKYPHADLSKFKFVVMLNPKTLSVKGTNIFYQVGGGVADDITSDEFKNKYSDALYWSPRIWSTRGTVQPLKFLMEKPTFNVERFKIYVDENDSFTSNFESLNTVWSNITNSKDITKVSFDYKTDPYFGSLLAAYIISYKSGISLKHLKNDPNTPKIITSIARYYIYYHMKRFLTYPDKMDFYTNEQDVNLVQKNIPTKKFWVNKLDHTQEKISIWYENKKNKHNIRNYHYEMSGDAGQGILGISYQEVDKVVNISDQDWIKFLKSDSDGLTKTGQKLFQHAIESYVYCILGAQALTHWPIVNVGAKSLQSQDIFNKLVKDTILQNDVSVSISNMRRAIKDTNVVLNMVISPGIILIPSTMIILKKKIPGYNNTLTLATDDMKFGKNTNINYLKPVGESEDDELPKNNKPVITDAVAKRSASDKHKLKPKQEFMSQRVKRNKAQTTVYKSSSLQSELYLFGVTLISGLLFSKYVL